MERRERTKLLIETGRHLALEMAAHLITCYPMEVISEPREALTMVKMRESAQNTLYYIGEVLVTECKVRMAGAMGVGLLKGHDTEMAMALAVIDACFRAEVPETKVFERELDTLRSVHREREEALQNRLAETRVDFNTMQQYGQ